MVGWTGHSLGLCLMGTWRFSNAKLGVHMISKSGVIGPQSQDDYLFFYYPKISEGCNTLLNNDHKFIFLS